MYNIDLNGKWKMRQVDTTKWILGNVPGDVYNDLLEANEIEDPFYRENELEALKLSYNDFEYTKEFQVTEELLKYDNVILCCQGIDTISIITLNDIEIARTDNMHRIYEFDIKKSLKLGDNNLHIKLLAPATFVEEEHKKNPLCKGKDSLQGIYYLRKAHSMFGWDWGPKLPDMGIWRSISVEAYDIDKIEQVYVSQLHNDDSVELSITVDRENKDTKNAEVEINITGPDGTSIIVRSKIDKKSETIKVNIENPLIWWPSGYGNQYLYKIETTLIQDEIVLDKNEMRIGLRTISVRQEKDQWGKSFEVVVNKKALFLMGADYIPEDNLLGRRSKDKTERLLNDCKKANFNCIRVWGGGHYPEDYFFDLCDELGLLVWQDFMFACRLYDLTESFKENIQLEFKDNIRRIRHHASLALWCGNNEIEWGLYDNWLPDSKENRVNYLKQYNEVVPEVLMKEDPDRFYWPSSPSSNGTFDDPNSDTVGDMHYWGVWHETKPFDDYRNYYPRFMSEFGLQSFPGIKTVNTFTEEDDRNIFSPVMENHQKNDSCNAKILHYISETFRYPEGFENLLDVSQLIQAEGIKYGVEHWRRNRGRCMGAIYWQLNDCWPVASWASIDYFGRWKALHYAAKRFFNQILISACEEGADISLHVTNDTFTDISGSLIWKLKTLDGVVIDEDKFTVSVNQLTSKKCVELDFSDKLRNSNDLRTHYLEFEYNLEDNTVSQGTVIFVKPKHLELKDPEIKATISEVDNSFTLSLISKSFAKYIKLELSEDDCIFEDNYFDLSPNLERKIVVLRKDLSKELSKNEFKNQLRISSLIDTY